MFWKQKEPEVTKPRGGGTQAAALGIVGRPLHVNLPPNSREAQVRHLRRMLKAIDRIGQKRSDEQTDVAIEELRRRRHALGMVGIDVPQGREGIEKLLAELEG